MWRDVGLDRWLFEIDQATGARVAERLVEIGKDLPAARETARRAREMARKRMAEMVAGIR